VETLMPRGPKGEKRPADVIGMSVKVMRIATGEEEEELDRAKSAAAELGARGGKARPARQPGAADHGRPQGVSERGRGSAFGADVDYGMLVKLYGERLRSPEVARRYTPTECVGARMD